MLEQGPPESPLLGREPVTLSPNPGRFAHLSHIPPRARKYSIFDGQRDNDVPNIQEHNLRRRFSAQVSDFNQKPPTNEPEFEVPELASNQKPRFAAPRNSSGSIPGLASRRSSELQNGPQLASHWL